MAQTAWIPRHDFADRSYLLQNGDVLRAPQLEETVTGLKVRVAGTNISMYAKDTNDVIRAGLEEVAKGRGTAVWSAADLKHEALHEVIGFDPDDTRARFFLNPEAVAEQEPTTVWWRFAHKTLPLQAMLVIRAKRSGGTTSPRATISTALTYQWLVPTTDSTGGFALDPQYNVAHGNSFNEVYMTLPYGPDSKWNEFVLANPNSLGEDLLMTERTMDERVAVKKLLDQIRACDDLDKVQIPDMRGVATYAFGWLDLDFVDSNVNRQLTTEITDYLESGSAEEEIRSALASLRAGFRRLGMVLEDKDSHIMAALQAGDDKALTFYLDNAIVDEEGNQAPDGHRVALHLGTGSIVVTCSNDLAEDAAHKWDEARILADITGKKEAFMGHCAEYFDQHHAKKTRAAIRVRRKQVEDSSDD